MAQNVIINGVTYSNVPKVNIPKSGGGTAQFLDTADATAVAGDMLSGKVAYNANGRIIGTIANRGTVSQQISNVDDEILVQAGYVQEVRVQIDLEEVDKITPGNIKNGVSILGVTGTLTSATITQDNVTHVLSIS